MPHIICSVCSREKSKEAGNLPPAQRYLGTHVAMVESKARRGGFPFFVLSGFLGLIPWNHPTPYYDYLLTQKDVLRLADLIFRQLQYYDIRKIYLYIKMKPNWAPYREALELAAEYCGVALVVCPLGDDD